MKGLRARGAPGMAPTLQLPPDGAAGRFAALDQGGLPTSRRMFPPENEDTKSAGLKERMFEIPARTGG